MVTLWKFEHNKIFNLARMNKKKQRSGQVEALFSFEDVISPWETKGVFSEHYLRNRLPKANNYPSSEITRPIYDFINDLWRKKHIGLGGGNEDLTRKEFIDKVLEKLGFSFYPNLDLPDSTRRQTPDYLLFESEKEKERVFNDTLETKYRAAIGLLEAKKVNHPLDQVSKVETPGKFPHQQVKDYLQNATDKDGRPYFRWAILTNGNIWRLYCRDAHPSAYFEFKLAGSSEFFCSFDDFKIFLTLFQSSSFVVTEERCFLDDTREESIAFQNDLEQDLRERIFTVVEDLGNGFWKHKDNNVSENELPKLYEKCLIFLYRLLFVLYAEGRGLLPVKISGVGANKEYRTRYSLQRLIPRLKNQSDFYNDDITDLYDDILRLFNLINGGKPQLNKTCDVPRYNGGLFDSTAHIELEKWKIGEKSLANVLRDLIFSGGHRVRKNQITLEFGTIDYADLEVRQLGDIYEGLLGGHFAIENEKIVLVDERGQRQVSGTFYTPDWVVRFIIEKTLKPLIDEIDNSDEVKLSIQKKKKDNSFALEVLKLNILDNAMGSGHFLVRATEWLADEIVYHPTTEFKIHNVSKGLSQEQAEISYWRRRVVEACIYGVDQNLLAVELSKLSLWLTCIAANEPLNFLDHHLRRGNSLISVKLEDLFFLPGLNEQQQISISFGKDLEKSVRDAIHQIEEIEEEASTEIDIVKKKEERWRNKVLNELQPYKNIADLWIAAASGVSINESEYELLVNNYFAPINPRSKEHAMVKEVQQRIEEDLKKTIDNIQPFHWELEFPDVFFADDGKRKINCGFDAIVGNPPYISTQTSSDFDSRRLMQQRFSFVDDLYVHFTFKGFELLRQGGRFGYIVSDTFFTLATKQRMRELLQSKKLEVLSPCDPFDATVDASIFIAANKPFVVTDDLIFIQARYKSDHHNPIKDLPELATSKLPLMTVGNAFALTEYDKKVTHGIKGSLRLHKIPAGVFHLAAKRVFFEPTETNILLFNRYNHVLKILISKWWEKIETSKKYDNNRNDITQYTSQLKPGDITLVGLIADGGQGMRTANNGRFLGYLQNSLQAIAINIRQQELLAEWKSNKKISPVLTSLLQKINGEFESVVELLKEKFHPTRDLQLKRGEVYRIVPSENVSTSEDFERTYELRKAELKLHWEKSKFLKDAYAEFSGKFNNNFVEVCNALLAYARNKKVPFSELGLRAGELYINEQDGPRIATIYNGLHGKRVWVPFRKGDSEGNKWTDNEPLYICWSRENVEWLSTDPQARWQGQNMFFTSGVTYTLLGNHVSLKAKLQPPCVFDAGASRLTPIVDQISVNAFLAILNSNVFSFFIRKFIKNTAAYEINDLRMAPIVIPTKEQKERLEMLSLYAVKTKELVLESKEPTIKIIQYANTLLDKQKSAPEYLHPNTQVRLLSSSQNCLDAIELSVQWEVEKLYGVEGQGPFDEF